LPTDEVQSRMSEDKERSPIRYIILLPVGVFVVGIAVAGIAMLVNPAADFVKMGEGVGALFLVFLVIGWYMDSQAKKHRDE